MGPPLRVVCTPSEEIDFFFLCKWSSVGDSFAVSDGSSHPLPTLSTGSHLTWTCAGPVLAVTDSWVHVYASPVIAGRHSFLDAIRPFGLLDPFCLFFHSFLSPKERVGKDILFMAECFQVSYSAECLTVGLWIRSCLLSVEDFLRLTDLCI